MRVPLLSSDESAPLMALRHLDDLWFQVSGTVCNLTCNHCFISCSPENHSFGFLGLDMVGQALEESVTLGVTEYYFTGGEPFLNREIVPILELALRYGPATVLTNGTVLKDEWLAHLRQADAESPYSLEFRVSIDGFTAEENDRVRGAGTFARIMRGISQLVRHGFLPIVTVTETRDDQDHAELVRGFVQLMRGHGYARPRLKILPSLRIGAEAERRRGYAPSERVTAGMMEGFDSGQLICSHSRIVTDRGVFVCPILIDSPEARLGPTLAESHRPYPLRHQACFTCYQHGALCSNPSGVDRSLH